MADYDTFMVYAGVYPNVDTAEADYQAVKDLYLLCSQCGFENPATTLFCGGCGSRIEQACSQCDFRNPPSFSFCGNCGRQLVAPVEYSIEGSQLIERTLPAELRERGLSQRHRIEGERRQVTVLFCDMAGFTSVTERIGPEAAYHMMERIYEILMRRVYEFEGTVNELTGDGIMALFGAPVALEDAPQRAIRAALAIHRDLARFNDESSQERGGLPPVRMRIGIHTGPVVVGTLGNDLRVEFKAVGDTVNLTSRLQDMAEPGTTLTTAETFELTEGLFRFEALGDRRVKGKQVSVPTYRVVAPSASRTRFDVSAERGLNPFIGRERELEILLDGFRRAAMGRGQAISISAEAGLGKSRLLYEFRKATSADAVTFLEGRCLSYHRNLAYFPLIDLLRSAFDLDESDPDSVLRDKLSPALSLWGVQKSTSLPWLIELLAATSGDLDETTYTPEARKAQVTRALAEILIAASEYQPLIVAIEDLHWIDRNSEELLGHLLNSISGSRILMVLTYRPEYPHALGTRTYHSQLTLNRLSNQETLAMARHQLGGRAMDEWLEDLVLEKTEGVPFFVEEFLKSLLDLRLLKLSDDTWHLTDTFEDLSVPITIQDVLRARVDVLPDNAKTLLKTASVLGREMSHELLRNLTGTSEEELLTDLSVLKDAELLYERGVYPHSTYLFRHALTQEVVHDSLLHEQRRDLHRKAGDVIESTYRTNLVEQYAVLAEHFTAGEDFERAAEYSRLAARDARQAGAFPTAIEYTEKSIRCISRLPPSDPNLRKSIHARTTLAGYYLNQGRPHQAAAAVAPIVEAARVLEDRSSWPAILTSVGLHELFATEDLAAARRHLDQVASTPVDAASARWHWFAAYYLSAFLAWNCEFEEGTRELEKARAISSAAGRAEGVATANNSLGLGLVYQGRLGEASAIIDKAVADATVSHDPNAETLTEIATGALRFAQGFNSAAKRHLLNGLRSTGETAQSFWRSIDLLYLGDTLVRLRSYRDAKQRYEEGLAILEHAELVPSWQNVIKLKLAHAGALNRENGGRLDELRAWREGVRFRLFEGLTARLIAQTLLARELVDLDEAQHWLETALASDRAEELALDMAHDHLCLADLYRRRNDPGGVFRSSTEARRLFAECGAEGFVEEIDRHLGASASSE